MQFRRSDLPEKDLVKLAVAYSLSESQELKESVMILSRWRGLEFSVSVGPCCRQYLILDRRRFPVK
jgi:hypothetical protein